MQLTSGTLLQGGKYKIEKVLGQGSFGITYLAEHMALGKKVCIKEFFMKELNSRGDDGSITGLSDGSLSYNYARKFRKEAQNLARMEHPNIVKVTDSFDENATFYYVMEYIEGQDLNTYIKQHALSEAEAVAIIKDVANALIYMHEEKHMLHLDLKPGNVMRRNSDGHIFLIDFGLSKNYDKNGAPETSTTIGLGTAGYAPIEQPNQAKNGEFRPTIDVYALGATLYKLLTRETPPPASELVTDDELISDKLKEHNVSDAISSVVVNAMLPNVRKRTHTIKAFVDALHSSSEHQPLVTKGKETVDEEKTLFVGEIKTATEETEIIAPHEKVCHPDFDESTYKIDSEYIKFPVVTGNKAKEGDVEAMLALGMMALRGEGVRQDFDTAHAWFLKLKNLGDDRGEKLITQWTSLKDKYSTNSKETNETANTTESNDNGGNIIGWIVAIIMFVAILIVCVQSCNDAREAKEAARIESIVKNTKDWYGAGNGQFYCMVEGEKYYVGTYDIPDGQRTIHYSSGDTFVGTFKGGRKSQGKLTYKNGDYFGGTFSNGSKDTGYGKESSYDGSHVYEGNYKNGMWNGKGTESWPKEKRKNWGCMLECTYSNNIRNGVGTWYFNDHTYEKRRFTNGKEGSTIERGTWR